MKNNTNFRLYEYKNQPDDLTVYHQRFNYLGHVQNTSSSVKRFILGQVEKQNSIRDTNLTRLSPTIYEPQEHRFTKSTSSTNQQSHPKTSTQNLHNLRLESQVLELQKTLDQQSFQIQTLTQQATHFMKLCQEQKQVLIGLNIQGMKLQYEQQIQQLIQERQKVQEIIGQLQDDYNEVYVREQNELNFMRNRNCQISKIIDDELQRKKALLSLISAKDQQLFTLEVDLRQTQQRIDELRNIQRKLNIAIRQLEMFKKKKSIKGQFQHSKDKFQQKQKQIMQSKQGSSLNQLQCKSFRDKNTPKKKYNYEYLNS